MLVFATIWLLIKDKTWSAAIIYGLCMHWDPYTIIYSLSFFYFQNYYKNGVKFTVLSFATFFVLTGVFHLLYGNQFAERYYFYTKPEFKLNYSVYWYFNFLTMD